MKTIYGTLGDDLLNGGFGLDEIFGYDGNDTINGYAKRDTIHGGDGDDRIFTGSGPDVAYGGAGNDFIMDDLSTGGVSVLRGGDGDDVIRAGYGADIGPFPVRSVWWMFGDDGDDKLIAGEGGKAFLFGGSGRDILMMSSYGGGEAHGGAGNDILMSEHRSRINEEVELGDKYGPGASVILDGGVGNDRLYGYSANFDTFVFRPGEGRDIIHNLGTGELYYDRIDLRAFNFDMTAEEVFAQFGHERNDRIILKFAEDSQIHILDTPYYGGTDISAQDVIDALWL